MSPMYLLCSLGPSFIGRWGHFGSHLKAQNQQGKSINRPFIFIHTTKEQRRPSRRGKANGVALDAGIEFETLISVLFSLSGSERQP